MHCIRDTQLHENKHRYGSNGAGVLAMLRAPALNLVCLAGFGLNRDGQHMVMHHSGLLEVCSTRLRPVAALTMLCAETATAPWLPSPSLRLL